MMHALLWLLDVKQLVGVNEGSGEKKMIEQH
jgi:hypothetical protein